MRLLILFFMSLSLFGCRHNDRSSSLALTETQGVVTHEIRAGGLKNFEAKANQVYMLKSKRKFSKSTSLELDVDSDVVYLKVPRATEVRLRQKVCFIAGTKILTPEGLRNIEDLEKGDEVLSFDESSGEVVVGEIEHTTRTAQHEYGILLLSDGTELSVTANHPFYLPQQKAWLEAARIERGDLLLKVDAESRKSTMVTLAAPFLTRSDLVEDVFNLKIKDYKNYFAEGVLVHNY